MQVDFYHLTHAPLSRVLPAIAEKVVAGGARLLVVSDDAAQRAAIDRLLWTYAPDGFLAHAQQGAGDDAAQPVLIAASPEAAAANGARHLALVDGTWRDAALAFERVFHLFGDDRIDAAREAWRALAGRTLAGHEGAGHEAVERRYWRQDEAGRWTRAA